MHYANGRPAKNGDRIVRVAHNYSKGDISITSGILHNAVAGYDDCNGTLLPTDFGTMVNLKECLHEDDLVALLGTTPISDVRDTSKETADPVPPDIA